MPPTIDPAALQSLLDNGVKNGVAPGFQCVVFDRDSFVFNGVSGWATVPSSQAPEGKTMKPETLVWVASCGKLSVALIVLHIIENGLAKSGFSINDLDNPEALVEILPEFKHGSGSLLTKIIEGFEDELGYDGKKVMKLRDAKGRVTLRMLLTHTAGLGYDWNHPLMRELDLPSDGSVPNFSVAFSSGNIRDFELPLVNEPGTAYHYGFAYDWLGQFAVRSTGRSLRELYKEIIFQPLGIPPSEADIWISPALSEARAPAYTRGVDNGWAQSSYELYATEGKPPEGKSYCGGGCVISSLQAHAKILQAVLSQNSKILSKGLWEMVVKDDLKLRGLAVPKPAWKSSFPERAKDGQEFAKSTIENGAGINLLGCHVALGQTLSGRPAGSFAWAGLLNTYYFIDPVEGVGAIFGTQIFPFFDASVVGLRDEIEALIYKNADN